MPLCINNASASLLLCIRPCINNTGQFSVHACRDELARGEIVGGAHRQRAGPRGQAGARLIRRPLQSPRRATNEAVIIPCPCCPAASSPTSHTHTHTSQITHCLLSYTTQHFLHSRYRGEFKCSPVLDRQSIVVSAGCKNRPMFKGKRSF